MVAQAPTIASVSQSARKRKKGIPPFQEASWKSHTTLLVTSVTLVTQPCLAARQAKTFRFYLFFLKLKGELPIHCQRDHSSRGFPRHGVELIPSHLCHHLRFDSICQVVSQGLGKKTYDFSTQTWLGLSSKSTKLTSPPFHSSVHHGSFLKNSLGHIQ